MWTSRIQFQPGLSWAEFLARYGGEAACEQALAQARWPEGFVCPRRGARHAHAFSRFGKACWRSVLLAMYRLGQSKNAIALPELRRQLGVCRRGTWRLKHKLMQAMTQDEADRQLGGLVQVNDAYLGAGGGGLQRWLGGVSGRGGAACPHSDPIPAGQGRHRRYLPPLA